MDLTSILEIGIIAGFAGVGGTILSLVLLLPRLSGLVAPLIDGYVANFVGQFSKNDEFRQSLTEPVIQDALSLILANKDTISAEFINSIQKQMGSKGAGNLNIGGMKIPMEGLNLIAGLLGGGNVKNKAVEGVASLIG